MTWAGNAVVVNVPTYVEGNLFRRNKRLEISLAEIQI